MNSDAGIIVKHAFSIYSEFLNNGTLHVLKLGYRKDELLSLLNRERLTRELSDSIQDLFQKLGASASYDDRIQLLSLELDERNLVVNWRSLI